MPDADATPASSDPSGAVLAWAGPAAVSLFAVTALVGHAVDVAALTSLHADWPAMAPGTSLGLLIGAGAVAAAARDLDRRARRLSAVSGALLIVLSAVLLAWNVSGDAAGFVARVLTDLGATAFEGVPGTSPATAVSLLLMGVAALPLQLGRASRPVASSLALSVATLAYVALLGYAFGLSDLYAPANLPPGVGMAATTALSLLLLSSVLLERWARRLRRTAGVNRWNLPRIWLVSLAGAGVLAVLILAPRQSPVALIVALAVSVTANYVAIANSWEETARALRTQRSAEAARQRFVTSVSHHARTRLTAVFGIAELLSERGEALQPDQRQELNDQLFEAAEELQRMLTGLLDLGLYRRGDEPDERSVVQLDDVVRQAIHDLDMENELVEARLAPVSGHVQPRRLYSAVQELLLNVAMHTPPGTSAEVALTETSELVELVVTDDGSGLHGIDAATIFGAFKSGSAESADPRIGIGLSKVKLFAKIHGGTVRAEEAELGGLIVRISIPRTELEPQG